MQAVIRNDAEINVEKVCNVRLINLSVTIKADTALRVVAEACALVIKRAA